MKTGARPTGGCSRGYSPLYEKGWMDMGFRVYDLDGKDVTKERDWMVDSEGTLLYFDGLCHDAGKSYWCSMN